MGVLGAAIGELVFSFQMSGSAHTTMSYVPLPCSNSIWPPHWGTPEIV